MHIITTFISDDEPAEAYYMGPKVMPGWAEDQSIRMMEQIFVYRNDAIAKYEQDWGLASGYGYVPPMMVPSFGAEKVGFLREMGQAHIHDTRWARRMREMKEASTMFKDAIKAEEQRHLVIQNLSSFGPGGSFQRNGYSHETAMRKYKSLRQERTGKIQK